MTKALDGVLRGSQRMMRRLLAALAVILVLGAVTTASAMRVSPMVSEISTRGAGSSARIEVQNVGSAALPYETRITRIDFNAEGDLVETPADDDFLVFPPQGVVPVGGRQVIRVQWVGDPDLAVSRAYYVGIRQLPVELDEPTEDGVAARVQVVYHMKSLVTVAPPGVKADVSVLSVKPVEVSGVPAAPEIDPALTGGQPTPAAEAPVETLVPGIEVRVRNSGRRYALMSGATWIVEGVGPDGKVTEVRLDNTAVNEAVGVGYVAPIDGERVFRLPTGIRFAGDKPIRVRFSQ